jgi:hypothetical protein
MNNRSPSRWYYGIAGLIVLVGIFSTVYLFKRSGIATYPVLIADAYDEEQHHLKVPGSKDVKLVRTGAYGIYYENNLIDTHEEVLPAIDCSLTSKSTGVKIEAVPDYVETNRYWSNDQNRNGVLIMSITVDKPDRYRFACHYQDGSTRPEISVALGPNYFWEFLRVAWKISLPTLGVMSTFCGSLLLALLFVIVVAIKRAGV